MIALSLREDLLRKRLYYEGLVSTHCVRRAARGFLSTRKGQCLLVHVIVVLLLRRCMYPVPPRQFTFKRIAQLFSASNERILVYAAPCSKSPQACEGAARTRSCFAHGVGQSRCICLCCYPCWSSAANGSTLAVVFALDVACGVDDLRICCRVVGRWE